MYHNCPRMYNNYIKYVTFSPNFSKFDSPLIRLFDYPSTPIPMRKAVGLIVHKLIDECLIQFVILSEA